MAKMFQGKDNKSEEMAEAKALKSGKISKADYVAGEKKEGHGKGAAKMGAAIKSGKVSPSQYAAGHKKMADGGYAGRAMPAQANAGGAMRGQARAAAMSGRTFADGGAVCGMGKGPTRSKQDYGK